MKALVEQARETLEFFKKIYPSVPDWAIVLGSGMGDLVADIENSITIPYSEIPHFQISTVQGHAGKMTFGSWAGKSVVVMQGRFHFYEGYPLTQVTFPMRVFGLLGIKNLLLSNAAGGLNPHQKLGEVMWISDHINFMGTNPLIGPHREAWGSRFPDMSQVYDPHFLRGALKISEKHGLLHSRGIYMAVTGPTYETPAEYKAFRVFGADAVGMSTVPESIIAHQMGMRIVGFSVISDLGIEGKIEAISHEMVVKEVEKTAGKMRQVVPEVLGLID
jgi:purine-nucleoside phosphorylase